MTPRTRLKAPERRLQRKQKKLGSPQPREPKRVWARRRRLERKQGKQPQKSPKTLRRQPKREQRKQARALRRPARQLRARNESWVVASATPSTHLAAGLIVSVGMRRKLSSERPCHFDMPTYRSARPQ